MNRQEKYKAAMNKTPKASKPPKVSTRGKPPTHADAEALRQQGFTVRRQRTHAVTTPPRK